ncbi:hypothetical protein AB6A40_002488 [Gnathostoma spinigerum]|uniref:tRNA-splicing endonuclease subunit Sen54 N-terminal domain-containing protein n=1 Tax=Gnathostoma spinigerum TaxID=75299 RepID=A0ABD6E6Q8_9BILA
MECGGRSRNKEALILINYIPDQRRLEATQNRTKRFETMGKPIRNGHLFYAEEAVWLVEAALGCVLYHDIPLSVQQAFRMLEDFKVPWCNYLIYSYFKRAGYVIFPFNVQLIEPTQTQASNSTDDECTTSSDSSNSARFPVSLLEQFPTVSYSHTSIVPLHRLSRTTSVFDVSERICDSPSRLVELLRVSSSRRFDRKRAHTEYLRPRYWSRFDGFTRRCRTWNDYRRLRDGAIRPQRPALCPFISQGAARRLTPHYNVYKSPSIYCHSSPPPPSFSVIVTDLSISPMPTSTDLIELSSSLSDRPIIIAGYRNSHIIFYDINLKPVPL